MDSESNRAKVAYSSLQQSISKEASLSSPQFSPSFPQPKSDRPTTDSELSDSQAESQLKQQLEDAVNSQYSLESVSTALSNLFRFYRTEKRFEDAESTLVEMLKLQRYSDVPDILSELKKLYRFVIPHKSTEIIIEIKRILIDQKSLPKKLLWEIFKSTAVLHVMWGQLEKAQSLLQQLATNAKNTDVQYWASIQLKISKLYRKAKQHSDAEDLVWSTFQEIKSWDMSENIAEIIRDSLRCLHNPLKIETYRRELQASRMVEIGVYLQRQADRDLSRIMSDFLAKTGFFGILLNDSDVRHVLESTVNILVETSDPTMLNESYFQLAKIYDYHFPGNAQITEKLLLKALMYENLRNRPLVFLHISRLMKRGINSEKSERFQLNLLRIPSPYWCISRNSLSLRAFY